MTNLDAIAGSSGMIIIDNTSANTGLNYSYLLPREDTVISVCTGVDRNGNSVDFKSVHNWDGTVKATDFLIVPSGSIIKSITLTSGSLQCF